MLSKTFISTGAKDARRFERIGDNLYRRGSGLIYARVKVDGKRTFRCTDTDDATVARKVLKKWRDDEVLKRHGIEPKIAALARNRLSVGKVLDAYVAAGCPTKKMLPKLPATIASELKNLNMLRAYFTERVAVTLTLNDCDEYRRWRNSGGYVAERKLKDGRTVKQQTKGGDRGVDLELTTLNNALGLAWRRGQLKSNPLAGRTRYGVAARVRHCREVAPTPQGLLQIEHWLRARGEDETADLICLMAFTGLRIGEALPLEWEAVNWTDSVLHVKREKRGIMPWVPVLPELHGLLLEMQKRTRSYLLFPSPHDAERVRDKARVNRRLKAACEALGIGHVTPHGLRSYFVTQARQSGLTDAEIAMLIGDKTGPAIIAHTYGDVRPDHLLKQARRIQLRATGRAVEPVANVA